MTWDLTLNGPADLRKLSGARNELVALVSGADPERSGYNLEFAHAVENAATRVNAGWNGYDAKIGPELSGKLAATHDPASFANGVGNGIRAWNVDYAVALAGYGTLAYAYSNVVNRERSSRDFSGEWNVSEDGATINGRRYTQHALERMAPNTPEIRAELYTRAMERAESAGKIPGSKDYYNFVNSQVDPRGIPPSVVENTIQNSSAANVGAGKFRYQSQDITVFTNVGGDVITVIPR
jgi:hypothetical protein